MHQLLVNLLLVILVQVEHHLLILGSIIGLALELMQELFLGFKIVVLAQVRILSFEVAMAKLHKW